MARVVVVGGGFGGLASAVRLAKLGHDVTLTERADTLGGALAFETDEGFASREILGNVGRLVWPCRGNAHRKAYGAPRLF